MDVRLKLYRGSWCAVWRENGETKRRSLRTEDRAAAQRAIEGFTAALAAPQGDTVADAYAAYTMAKGTPRAKWAWERMKPAFGHLLPEQVTRDTCEAYITQRRRQAVSDGTIYTELTFLRAALRFADKQTPAQVVLPSKPDALERYLTHEEYDALLGAATTPHVRLFIVLALATAGRMTAILELTWDQIDFERGVIRLGKGRPSVDLMDDAPVISRRKKGRATVPMTERAMVELKEAAKGRTTNHVIEYGGKQIGKIRKAFMKVAMQAGLPDCTPHVLRHTAAVWMAEAGVPMAEISQYLGHADSRITERVYARFSPKYLRHAAKALER